VPSTAWRRAPRFARRAADRFEAKMRETFFGDMPLTTWAASGVGEPWSRFKLAAARFAKGDRDEAFKALEEILNRPDLESRHYLEAWTAYRENGVQPPAHLAKKVLGVVLDVPVEGGFDTLAAYPDWHARYLNVSGAAIVWDAAGAQPRTHAHQPPHPVGPPLWRRTVRGVHAGPERRAHPDRGHQPDARADRAAPLGDRRRTKSPGLPSGLDGARAAGDHAAHHGQESAKHFRQQARRGDA
jgi:hypothetical protein